MAFFDNESYSKKGWDFEIEEGELPKSKRGKWELLDWNWKLRRIISTVLNIPPILCAYYGIYKGEKDMIKLVVIIRPKVFKTMYFLREPFNIAVELRLKEYLSEISALNKVPKEKIRKKIKVKDSSHWTTIPF
jgi:hypothetical protein